MKPPDAPADSNPHRQLRQHIDSLRAAGVEWLDLTPAPRTADQPPASPTSVEPGGPISTGRSLFDSPSETSALDPAQKKKSLEVLNEKGQVALRYFLHGCWVSEFTAVPQLDANANAIAVESIKIELEGWERDPDSQEPDEATAPSVPAA